MTASVCRSAQDRRLACYFRAETVPGRAADETDLVLDFTPAAR
jgi:hypothetical protein